LLGSLSDSIRRHLADNIWIYLIIIFMFILGISLGALTVNNIDDVSKTDATTYIKGFLDLTSQNELQSAYILKQSIKFNFYFTLAIFLSGLTYLGMLFIPLIVAFRGFCIGFTVAFLTENLVSNGFLLSLGSILPQNLIYVPVIIVMGAIGLNYSVLTLRNKHFKRFGTIQNLFATYALSALVLFILLIAGCIVESYITSQIIRMITHYMV